MIALLLIQLLESFVPLVHYTLLILVQRFVGVVGLLFVALLDSYLDQAAVCRDASSALDFVLIFAIFTSVCEVIELNKERKWSNIGWNWIFRSFFVILIDAASWLIFQKEFDHFYWFKICSSIGVSLIVSIWVFRLDCLLKCFPEKLTRYFDGLGFKGTEYAHPSCRFLFVLVVCVLAPYILPKRMINSVWKMWCRLRASNRLGIFIGLTIFVRGSIYMILGDEKIAMEVWKVSFYLIIMPITAALFEMFVSVSIFSISASALRQFTKLKLEVFWWIHFYQAVIFVSTVLTGYGSVPPVISYHSQFTFMYILVLIRLSAHVNAEKVSSHYYDNYFK